MSVGKYSPTVTASYMLDQKWWVRNGGGYGNGTNPDSYADNDGYDAYGYSQNGLGPDRAGNNEDNYLFGGEFDEETGEFSYPLYDRIDGEWRKRLLGDLPDYKSVSSIAAAHDWKPRAFNLYREFILTPDIRVLNSTHPYGSFLIHSGDEKAICDRYLAVVPAHMQ